MTSIVEGNLKFRFGDSWEVLKYDEGVGFYCLYVRNKIEGAKAADFLGLSDSMPLLILEVKDYSQGIANQEKFRKVPMTVAAKVKDTVAGILGGMHCASPESGKAFFQKSYRKLEKEPLVVFFFEDMDTPNRRPPQVAAGKRNVLHKELKQRLRWLTRNILVVGLNDCDRHIPGLKVSRIR